MPRPGVRFNLFCRFGVLIAVSAPLIGLIPLPGKGCNNQVRRNRRGNLNLARGKVNLHFGGRVQRFDRLFDDGLAVAAAHVRYGKFHWLSSYQGSGCKDDCAKARRSSTP